MSEIPLVEINSNLRILGTAHISSTSVAQVREQIETYQPDVVAVELTNVAVRACFIADFSTSVRRRMGPSAKIPS